MNTVPEHGDTGNPIIKRIQVACLSVPDMLGPRGPKKVQLDPFLLTFSQVKLSPVTQNQASLL